MRGRCSSRRRLRLRARPADIGQQQHGAHQVVGDLGQVAGRLEVFERSGERRLVFESFQVLGLEVLVQQRQRLGQRGGLQAHEPGKTLGGQREPGHPRLGACARAGGFVVQLEQPRIEPAARGDRFGKHRVPLLHERRRFEQSARRTATGSGRRGAAGFGIEDRAQPVRRRHRLGLQQGAAQQAVDRADVQRRAAIAVATAADIAVAMAIAAAALRLTGQFVEQFREPADFPVGKITHGVDAQIGALRPGGGPPSDGPLD
jgi:hypothetical protein